MKKFYTYVYLDPRKPGQYQYDNLPFSFLYEPFYIGKGKGRRYKDHLRECVVTTCNTHKNNRIRKIKRDGFEPLISKLKENLTEDEAFSLEREYILTIGRRDKKTGPLTNLTEGGDGPSDISEETRQKLSRLCKGVPKTEEHKRKIAESNKGKHDYTKEQREKARQRRLGSVTSEETKEKLRKYFKEHPVSYVRTPEIREKMSKSATGVPNSPEHNKKISEGLKRAGCKPSALCNQKSIESRIGKPRSEDVKQKLREANLGKKLSDETRAKMRLAHLRRKQAVLV